VAVTGPSAIRRRLGSLIAAKAQQTWEKKDWKLVPQTAVSLGKPWSNLVVQRGGGGSKVSTNKGNKKKRVTTKGMGTEHLRKEREV